MLPDSFWRLVDVLADRSVAVLTGAGCSTESGIPDYRGPDGPRRERAPISYQEFVRSEEARTRYWARSTVGWPRMTRARPNAAHRALAELEAGGVSCGVITQNVDGLHQAAGSRRVVELHGSLGRVTCLECGMAEDRGKVQARILERNSGWRARATELAPRDRDPGGEPGRPSSGTRDVGDVEIAPDGDAEIPDGALAGFRAPACRGCGGVLKPDVVFFGENVPADRVERAWDLLASGEALLVVGSSLAVYSGYRFVLRASEEQVPVAIVNLGHTRGDGRAHVRVHGRVGAVLPELADALLRDRDRGSRAVL